MLSLLLSDDTVLTTGWTEDQWCKQH